MPNKTLEQYQAEIEQLRKAMNLPGVPDEEKKIYADTIQRIEAKIIDLQRAAPQPQTSHPSQSKPQATQAARSIKPSFPRTREEGMGVGSNHADTPVIAAILSGAQKQVLIEWGHGKSDLLTEGEARSRFTTALRDLAESRMARLGRYDDLTRYITFSRAVAYYRALIEFWITAPTPQQLAIYPLSRIRQEIFDLITKASIC